MQQGLREHSRVIGHLEQDLLETLWKNGSCTGKEIYERIKSSRDIALTTVLTVLERLVKKGLVKKAKGQTVYGYMSACTKEELARRLSGDVLKGIIGISASGAAASFVDMLGSADPDELDRLSAIIESKKKELSEKKGKVGL